MNASRFILVFWQWIPEYVNAVIFVQDKTSPAFLAVKVFRSATHRTLCLLPGT